MKRGRQEHKEIALKRVKSEEESPTERVNQVGPEDSKATQILTTNIKNQIPSGFGFNSKTKKYYKPNRGRKVTENKDQLKDSRMSNSHRSNKTRISLKLDIPVADKSLETDAMDFERNDKTDKLDDVDKVDIAVVKKTSLPKIPSQDFRKTYPQRKSYESNLNDLDIEMDIIIPQKLKEKRLERPPSKVPTDYSDMKPKVINEPLISLSCVRIDILVRKQTAEEESIVRIPHTVNGKFISDEFGVRLKTYKTKTPDGREYYRHIFYDVDEGGPAFEMKIKNDYEMVLLNEVFVPDLTHSDVLKLFNEVKVDGLTRFQLVVRYVDRKTHPSSWVWIMTSAILSPDDRERPRGGDHPTVENEKFKVLPNNEFEWPPEKYRFCIRNTNKFIVIRDNTIETSFTPFDIFVTKRVKQDKYGNMTFTAALCGAKHNYVSVSGKKIVVKHTPFWFHVGQMSGDWTFQINDKYVDWSTNVITSRGPGSWLTQSPQNGTDAFDEVDAEPVPGTSRDDVPYIDENFDLTEYNTDTVEPTPRLMSTSSQNDSASYLGDSFHQESLSDIEFADADQSEMEQDNTQSSGYLTSGSLEEFTIDFTECPFDKLPKTPNTPMKSLTINVGKI